MQGDDGIAIAAYGQGTADVADVDTAVAAAWAEVLEDAEARAAAAAALGVTEDALPVEAPFSARSSASGLSGEGLHLVYTALTTFGTAVAYDLMKDEAKRAIRAAARGLWDVVRPRVTRRMDMGALGAEVDVRDDVQ